MRGKAKNACTLPSVTRVPRVAGLVLALAACQGKHDASPSPSQSSRPVAPPSAAAAASASAMPVASISSAAASATSAPGASPGPSGSATAAQAPFVADPKRYPWLADDRDFPKPDATLEQRFPTPPGYKRVKVPPGSFSEWLRTLPMAPEGTPAKKYDGQETLAGGDDYLAGVVAIDTGTPDLQQSSDVIIRLHAEYLWSR